MRGICGIKVPPEMKYTDWQWILDPTLICHDLPHDEDVQIPEMKSKPHVKMNGKSTMTGSVWTLVAWLIHLMLQEIKTNLLNCRNYEPYVLTIPNKLRVPEDFILRLENVTSSLTPVVFKCE